MTEQPLTKDDLKAAQERCAFIPKGHGIARDVTQPGPDSDTEWCVDNAGHVVAYCLGEESEDYAAFFANALTGLPRALAALEEAWGALDKIYKLCRETDAVDVWFTIRDVRDIARLFRAAQEG